MLHGKILEILGQKDPIPLDLQKYINPRKSPRGRTGEESRWSTTFLVHATVANFEYRYVFLDKSTGSLLANRKIMRSFQNPVHQTESLVLSSNYQIIGSVVTKLDSASYENFIYDKIFPNVILGKTVTYPLRLC